MNNIYRKSKKRLSFLFATLLVLLVTSSCKPNHSSLENDLNEASSIFSFFSTEPSSDKYATEIIIEHYYEDCGSLTQWNQSMAVYKNTAFLFLDTKAEAAANAGYSFVVIDLTTKEIIFRGETPTRNCHNNNAQFLNVFYETGDNYPLLLLSRGDYPDSPDAGKCYVVRITELDNVFKLSIVKTISCTIEQAKYNGSWVTDNRGNLFLYTLTLGTWEMPETEGNKFTIIRFDMFNPLDPTDLIISVDDLKGLSILDYCIFQGGDSFEGKLLFPIGKYTKINGKNAISKGNIIAIINPFTGVVEGTIPSDYLENEGISVYGNKVFVSSKDGSGSPETKTPTFRIKSFYI